MSSEKLEVVTLGVYGSTEASFFEALQEARVDLFCDVRQRRGIRGSKYKYANSKRLQFRLKELGIDYVHLKELAPTKSIRAVQKSADVDADTRKRERTTLAHSFKRAYHEQILHPYDFDDFMASLSSDVYVIALFCVEAEPEACHRSLIADAISERFNVRTIHLQP